MPALTSEAAAERSVTKAVAFMLMVMMDMYVYECIETGGVILSDQKRVALEVTGPAETTKIN